MVKKKINIDSWPAKIVLGIIIFLIFYVLSKIVVIFIYKYNDKKKKQESAKKLLFDFAIKGIGFFIVLVGVYIALKIFGVKMDTIMVVLGSAGLGIALSLNTFIAGCVNGLVIIAQGYFKPGDMIQVGKITGKVVHFDLLNTIIEDIDGVIHNMPNTDIVAKEQLNYSQPEYISAAATACISNSDPKVNPEEILREFGEELKKMKLNEKGDSFTYIKDMNEFGTFIEGGFNVKAENFYKSRKEMRYGLKDYLRKKGVLMCTDGSNYIGMNKK